MVLNKFPLLGQKLLPKSSYFLTALTQLTDDFGSNNWLTKHDVNQGKINHTVAQNQQSTFVLL